MILRRLTESIRRQDWFTVALEVLIVVLGVFRASKQTFSALKLSAWCIPDSSAEPSNTSATAAHGPDCCCRSRWATDSFWSIHRPRIGPSWEGRGASRTHWP